MFTDEIRSLIDEIKNWTDEETLEFFNQASHHFSASVLDKYRNQTSIYDNMYSKPPQQGDGLGNSKYSVSVFFQVEFGSKNMPADVHPGCYNGQYNFEKCTWHILPDSVPQPKYGITDDLISC
jgi:hypothetical protein